MRSKQKYPSSSSNPAIHKVTTNASSSDWIVLSLSFSENPKIDYFKILGFLHGAFSSYPPHYKDTTITLPTKGVFP